MHKGMISHGEDAAINHSKDIAEKVAKENLVYLPIAPGIGSKEDLNAVMPKYMDTSGSKQNKFTRIRKDEVGFNQSNIGLDHEEEFSTGFISYNESVQDYYGKPKEAAVSFVLVIVAILVLVAIVAIVAINMIPYIQVIGLD